MKEVFRKTYAPLHLLAGDSVEYTARFHDPVTGLLRTETATKAAERGMTIDTTVLIDLDQGELDQLGLSDAITMVCGESK